MARRPKTACNYPGCPELIEAAERYCREHRRLKDRCRATAAQRGYGYRWQQYRARFLKQNPLCVECKKHGRVEPATVVDHITPHKGNPKLFWDPSNHQALCKPCHDKKTGSGQ